MGEELEHVDFVTVLEDVLNRIGDLQDMTRVECSDNGDEGKIVVEFSRKHQYEISFRRI